MRVVYTSDHPIISVTVDVVALTIRSDTLCALVVRRGEEPHRGRWALPGGFLEVDECAQKVPRLRSAMDRPSGS